MVHLCAHGEPGGGRSARDGRKYHSVLGGIAPINPEFLRNLQRYCVLKHVGAVAVHGFPLDWNHCNIHEWPDKLGEIQAVTDLPVWISKVGASTFGDEEIQEFGLQQAAELLIGRSERMH